MNEAYVLVVFNRDGPEAAFGLFSTPLEAALQRQNPLLTMPGQDSRVLVVQPLTQTPGQSRA